MGRPGLGLFDVRRALWGDGFELLLLVVVRLLGGVRFWYLHMKRIEGVSGSVYVNNSPGEGALTLSHSW